jgi:hypothetical protein
MQWPSLRTYDRVDSSNQAAEREAGFEQSYFGMRLVIGVIGVLLPSLLVLMDWLLISQPLTIRGSMSAYYHSPARDLFVGGLSACGVTLVSYMFWKWWTWDFLVSLVGGFAVLGVAAFPTARPRPDAPKGADMTCNYSHAGIPPCTALQQAWGEASVRTVHLWVTAFVVGSFAGLCLIFALREFGYGAAAHKLAGENLSQLGPIRTWKKLTASHTWVWALGQVWRNSPRTVLYAMCLLGVAVGAAWASLGTNVVLPHSYAGEFVAFTSFGCAWIVASWDLLRRAGWLDTAVTGVGSAVGVRSHLL